MMKKAAWQSADRSPCSIGLDGVPFDVVIQKMMLFLGHDTRARCPRLRCSSL